MARQKKKRAQDKGPAQNKPKAFIHRPFSGLRVTGPKLAREPEPPVPVESLASSRDEHLDDMEVLARAMQGVRPLPEGPLLAQKPAEPRPMLAEQDDDALVMKALDELVHGETTFDFADTEEYIEACVQAFDRKILRKLRRGELSTEAHLDLHGFNRDQARAKVAEFIAHCHKSGKRCVLIIHGRGLGSKDNIPVLKNKLAAWLTRGAIGKKVLAYTSARPHDGGTGAVYVLLRG
ncbi:MAG: Smr/MutS family endonuclease [Myxococcota bacterium]|nr:Smr/MutS family endonuclease [Myxococcota bacterium]